MLVLPTWVVQEPLGKHCYWWHGRKTQSHFDAGVHTRSLIYVLAIEHKLWALCGSQNAVLKLQHPFFRLISRESAENLRN